MCLDIQGPEAFAVLWVMDVQKLWPRMQSRRWQGRYWLVDEDLRDPARLHRD